MTDSIRNHDGHQHGNEGRAELIAAVLVGAVLLVSWVAGFFSTPTWLIDVLRWIAFAIGGISIGRDVIGSLRKGKFAIDFLMFVAAIGAAAIGSVAEAALLLFLFNLGHSLEHYAMGRAKSAIQALARLAPRTALVKQGDGEVELPVEQLEPGMTVIVRPDQRVAADGIVIAGQSSVDQAPVTGESVPADKSPASPDTPDDKIPAESKVFAGTINGSGSLDVRVTRRSDDSTLARVVKLVTEAETRRSPTQVFTDKFQKWFVPVVLIFVVALMFVCVFTDETFRESFYRAMAVLVASSPCALAIATPSAVLSAVARAGRMGVLVKGGEPLENLGAVKAFAFDKTGTLTEGKPRLVQVVPMDGITEAGLLTTAVAIESKSDHPLARAVAQEGSIRLGDTATLPNVTDVESLTGRGIRAKLDGLDTWIGKPDFFTDLPGAAPTPELLTAVDKLEQDGCTTMVIRSGEIYLGVLGVMDTPRKTATSTLSQLRQLGVEKVVMISGDNQRVADAVGSEVGVDQARGGLLPEDKVDIIRELAETGSVAMVGDGVNDAPAMANATVGIAMGAAGSDVALETADVALMGDDLSKLPFTLGLGRATSSIIRQNLWISLGMVVLLIPATLTGLGIGPAVALHEGSTVIVVFNALRLLRFREQSS